MITAGDLIKRICEAFRKPGQVDVGVRVDERRGLMARPWPR
jgi:hypothetical protein